MDRVGRAYGTKVVLKDIGISYYYGAKIGVIGPNGAGKSSLFKILAGIDKDYTGETSLAPGYSIGYLEQEPYLEPGKTVMEIVKEGVKPITDLLAEFDKINEAFGEAMRDLLADLGYTDIQITKDIYGKARIIEGRMVG